MTCNLYIAKCTNDTTLGEEADLPEERATSYRHLDSMKEQANKTCMKFNKDKC